jgi:hypothetical protein
MLHWRRDQGRVGDHVPLEELTGATTIQPPGRGVDHLPREELQAAERANRVGDDAKFQRAESHGQRSHGGGGEKLSRMYQGNGGERTTFTQKPLPLRVKSKGTDEL